jgi:hypothetical protein
VFVPSYSPSKAYVAASLYKSNVTMALMLLPASGVNTIESPLCITIVDPSNFRNSVAASEVTINNNNLMSCIVSVLPICTDSLVIPCVVRNK